MSKDETEKQDESGLAGKLSITTERASRPAMLGRFQYNLATKLAIALFNPDPLQTIRHTLEAFFSLQSDEQALVEPDEKERENDRRRYQICTSLANMTPIGNDQWRRPLSIIPWSFARSTGESGYCQQFFELIGGIVWDPWTGEGEDEVLLRKALRKRDPAVMKWYWDWLAGQTSYGYDTSVCLGLKSEFITNNIEAIQLLGRSVVDNFIDPSVWQNAIETITGKSGGLKGESDRRVP